MPHSKSRTQQGNIKVILIVLLCLGSTFVAFLAAIAVPNFLEAQVRAKVARTMSDMRSMSNAIEAYSLDNKGGYPPALLPYLTTPIGYVPSEEPAMYTDIFSPENTLSYFAGKIGEADKATYWLLWSAGPDGKRDISEKLILERLEEKAPGERENMFSDLLFDPTNGTVSSGDMLRF